MSRYIDAEAFFKVINTLPYKDTSYPDASVYNGAISDVADMLTHFPAADVQEVRLGRWILDENPHDGDCRCSVCGVAIDAMNERNHEMLNILTGGKWWTFYHFCPKCGAKMDLEKDE